MAIDEALLAHAEPGGPLVLRIYQWSEPTLSLGHFQATSDIPAPLQSMPWVKRKTGGGAIVHDLELTYSIIVPKQPGNDQKGPNEELYRSVHQSILDGLIAMGFAAQLAESCTCSIANAEHPNPFLCFLRRSPIDLVVGPHKILGSAQRRTMSGLLQHGSLLLRHSSFATELLGLNDLQTANRPAAGEPNGSSSLWQPHPTADKTNPDASHRAQFSTNRAPSGPVSEELTALREQWCGWLAVQTQLGIDRVLPCQWRNGTLNDLPAVLRSFEAIGI